MPSQELHEFDVASGKSRRLLSPAQALAGAAEQLSPEEKARRERQRVSVGGFTAFEMSKDGTRVLLSLSGKLYVLTRASGEVLELATGAGTIVDPKWAPDGRSVSYVRDYDLYVFDLAGRREQAVTRGGTETVTHGLAEFVAQEEMGRFTGYWWSPDAQKLVFEESDASKVESWFVADPSKPEQRPARSFYPRPGKENVSVRVGIVPAAGQRAAGAPVWIAWDHARYPYLTGVNWREHGPLTVTVQTRDQTELALLEVDPATGRTQPLLTERDAAWVNLDQDMPRWLPESDGGGFLWTSERAGGWQLERRARDGSPREVLVPREIGYRGLVGIAGGEVYFRASADPTQTQLWRVPLAPGGKPPVALTTEPGQHGAEFGENTAIYVHTVQTLHALPRTWVRRWADSTIIGELPSIAQEPSLKLHAEPVKVGEGAGFHALVIRPRDFHPQSGRKYPVIVDVYGGPHHNHVLAALRPYLLDQWLADQGFIVVAADGRGTPGRGREWERAIAKKFGEVPLDDQVQALMALGDRFPELDLDRVGITGWSFGGYMAALAVIRLPEVFKAAVAGAPVTDWLDYDTHYTERYLGLPDAHPEAYRSASCSPGWKSWSARCCSSTAPRMTTSFSAIPCGSAMRCSARAGRLKCCRCRALRTWCRTPWCASSFPPASHGISAPTSARPRPRRQATNASVRAPRRRRANTRCLRCRTAFFPHSRSFMKPLRSTALHRCPPGRHRRVFDVHRLRRHPPCAGRKKRGGRRGRQGKISRQHGHQGQG